MSEVWIVSARVDGDSSFVILDVAGSRNRAKELAQEHVNHRTGEWVDFRNLSRLRVGTVTLDVDIWSVEE